ncbi:MAG: isochorismatase family protein [Desulfobacteraceae bacterium]|nr:isochorismatase family protein [Desulfobacteraceae bacterium]
MMGAGEILKNRGITGVIIYGLATDYCAMATALDALALGFKASLVEGLCLGVETDITRAALDETLAARVCILPIIRKIFQTDLPWLFLHLRSGSGYLYRQRFCGRSPE